MSFSTPTETVPFDDVMEEQFNALWRMGTSIAGALPSIIAYIFR